MSNKLTAKQKGDPLAPNFTLDDSPFYAMNRAIGFYDREMTRMLKAVGVDIPRWRILMLAHERGPISVSEIAEYAVIKQSTTTRVVQRMCRDRLITVEARATDARVTEVALTASGQAAVVRIRQAASKVYVKAFREFEPADVTVLLDLLHKIQGGLQEQL
jgi:DNA-binding MarR family transcriptional regulator